MKRKNSFSAKRPNKKKKGMSKQTPKEKTAMMVSNFKFWPTLAPSTMWVKLKFTDVLNPQETLPDSITYNQRTYIINWPGAPVGGGETPTGWTNLAEMYTRVRVWAAKFSGEFSNPFPTNAIYAGQFISGGQNASSGPASWTDWFSVDGNPWAKVLLLGPNTGDKSTRMITQFADLGKLYGDKEEFGIASETAGFTGSGGYSKSVPNYPFYGQQCFFNQSNSAFPETSEGPLKSKIVFYCQFYQRSYSDD